LTCEGFTKYGVIKFLEHSVTCSFICIMWVDAAFVASFLVSNLNKEILSEKIFEKFQNIVMF